MIPTDVGLQVRTQTEAGAHPIRAITDIPVELPELRAGQAFRARIEEVLPENTYKAVVAGRLLTLSLPEGAQVGDALDLVVVGRSGETVLAARGDATTGTQAPVFENAKLSATAQLIAGLLPQEGEQTPPASLSARGAVLARVPANGAEIARELPTALATAVGTSGLFYESHQAEWVLGQRPLASLLNEPQGRLSEPTAFAQAANANPSPGTAEPRSSANEVTQRQAQATGPRLDTAEAIGARTAAAGGESGVAQALTVPEALKSLVQQQLDAGATNRMLWHGEVWPGQDMDWEIHRDGSQRGTSSDGTEAPANWQTRMSIELPRLGKVDVLVQLSGTSTNVAVKASEQNSGVLLQAALPALQRSFAAAGLQLSGVQVSRDAA